ncbi:MAG: transposase [bacterium]|nr:transposase [bacterium]
MLAAHDRGMKTKQIATLFCVSSAWVRRVKQRRRETGETAPRKMGSPGVRKIDRDRLIELVRFDPDATLAELRDRLGITCSCWGVGKVLKQLGYSFKKRPSMPRNRIDPMSRRDETHGTPSNQPVTQAG